MSNPISGSYLSFAEREEIALLRAQGVGVREIARLIGRSPSTVSRELTLNAATRSGKLKYRRSFAQWKSELVARRPKPAKLLINPSLRQYVQDHLEGKIHVLKSAMFGPRQAPFIGRNKPHRGDWGLRCSRTKNPVKPFRHNETEFSLSFDTNRLFSNRQPPTANRSFIRNRGHHLPFLGQASMGVLNLASCSRGSQERIRQCKLTITFLAT